MYIKKHAGKCTVRVNKKLRKKSSEVKRHRIKKGLQMGNTRNSYNAIVRNILNMQEKGTKIKGVNSFSRQNMTRCKENVKELASTWKRDPDSFLKVVGKKKPGVYGYKFQSCYQEMKEFPYNEFNLFFFFFGREFFDNVVK